jgi:hypothetical protein
MVDQVRVMEDYRPCVNNNVLLKQFNNIEDAQAYLDEHWGYSNSAEVLQISMCRNNPDEDCEPEPWRVKYSCVSYRDAEKKWVDPDMVTGRLVREW